MTELFIEILSEEIPYRMQKEGAGILRKLIYKKLNDEQIFFQNDEIFYSPRRIGINLYNVSKKQPTKDLEIRGPRIEAPAKALDGFIKSNNLNRNNILSKKTDRGEFWFAKFQKIGVNTQDLIPKIISEIINDFPWSKSQRWGANSIKWIRPLKAINVIFNRKVLKFKIYGLERNSLTSNVTLGHSIVSRKKMKFFSYFEYKKLLKEEFTIIDPVERKKEILNQINKISAKVNLIPIVDENLLEEVTGLVEWPNAILGSIDPKYMKLPKEILITAMKFHQKYFYLTNQNNEIVPYFITLSNMPKNNVRDKNIRLGNERVLRARLEDAFFFWKNDNLIEKDKFDYKLKNLLFFDNLGSIFDKEQRIFKIAKYLSKFFTSLDLDVIKKASLLCKHDLVSGLVNEFPELQGIMGGYYFKKEGIKTSLAIKEHYLPYGPKDVLPSSYEGKILSIADKIDSVVGIFMLGEKFRPTGSKDPFAVRRFSLGIIRIIIDSNIKFPIANAISLAQNNYLNNKIVNIEKTNFNSSKTDILNFFKDRLKIVLKEKTVSHDVIEVLFSTNFSNLDDTDIYILYERCITLNDFLKTQLGENLKQLWQRTSKILDNEERKDTTVFKGVIKLSTHNNNDENGLIKKLNLLNSSNNYKSMLIERSKIKKEIDDFFEKNVINHSNKIKRNLRLNILALLRKKLLDIGNLSLLEG